MRVSIFGVRGSVPVTDPGSMGAGGNTSCVAISQDGRKPSLVLDAGTGVRNVSAVLGTAPFAGAIVLSHLHWDHVQGLPFFASADHSDAEVALLMPRQGEAAADVLARIMSPPFFPIAPGGLRGRWSVEGYDEGEHRLAGFSVLARELPHGGGRTMGLRVGDGRSSVAYLPDHGPTALGPGDDGLGALHPAALALASGADLLIHDAQYTAGAARAARLRARGRGLRGDPRRALRRAQGAAVPPRPVPHRRRARGDRHRPAARRRASRWTSPARARSSTYERAGAAARDRVALRVVELDRPQQLRAAVGPPGPPTTAPRPGRRARPRGC